jgi:hypothetical protein
VAVALVFFQKPANSEVFHPSLPFGNRAGQIFLFLIFLIGTLFAVAEMEKFERDSNNSHVDDQIPN